MNKKQMIEFIAKLKTANPNITEAEITEAIKKEIKTLEGEKEKNGALADSILKGLEGEEEEEEGDEEDDREEEVGGKSFKGMRGSAQKAYKVGEEEGQEEVETSLKNFKPSAKELAKDRKSFRKYIQTGEDTGRKTLTVGTGGGATVLVPKVVAAEILKETLEECNFIKDCDVVELGKGNEYTYVVRKTRIGKAVAGNETTAPTPTTSGEYDELKIGLEAIEIYPSVSKTTIMDVDYPVENDIKTEMTEEFADILETKFVTGTGDGISGIQGVIKHPDVLVVKTAVAGKATSDDLRALTRSLPPRYRKEGKIYISDAYETALNAEKESSTSNKKLWNNGDATKGIPATFDGFVVGYLKDLPGIATGSKVAVFANMKKAYKPIMKKEIITVRDEITNPKLIKLFTQIRAGGRVVRPWYAAVLEVL